MTQLPLSTIPLPSLAGLKLNKTAPVSGCLSTAEFERLEKAIDKMKDDINLNKTNQDRLEVKIEQMQKQIQSIDDRMQSLERKDGPYLSLVD